MPDPYPLEPARPRDRGCLVASLALFLGLACIAGVLWWSARHLTDTTRQLAGDVAARFQQVFHFTPEVRSNSVTIIQATLPVLELVTVQKQASVRNAWSQTWLHSTKTLEIEATFTARAGFDLEAPFVLDFDPATGAWRITLPPAKILNIGMTNIRILRDEDGFWNAITAEDREQAIRQLEEKARAEFARSSVLADAQTEAERRIREIIPAGRPVEFYPPTPAP